MCHSVKSYAVLGERVLHGGVDHTRTFDFADLSPSTPASNAQMAVAFIRGPCDADGGRRGLASRMRNHVPATAQLAVVAMPPPTMPANGDGDRLGDRKGLEPLGSRALGRRCRRRALACGLAQRRSSVPVRPLVAAHASISSRTHTSESSPRNVHRP